MRSGLQVADAMTVRPVIADPHASVRDVAALMDRYDIGSVLIKRGTELLGIVTQSDIVRRGVLEGCDMRHTPVGAIMTKDIVTVSPGMDLFDVVLLMKDTELRTFPVMDDGALVGFVTSKDILKLQPDLFENLVEAIQLREEERKLMRRDFKKGSALVDDDERA